MPGNRSTWSWTRLSMRWIRRPSNSACRSSPGHVSPTIVRQSSCTPFSIFAVAFPRMRASPRRGSQTSASSTCSSRSPALSTSSIAGTSTSRGSSSSRRRKPPSSPAPRRTRSCAVSTHGPWTAPPVCSAIRSSFLSTQARSRSIHRSCAASATPIPRPGSACAFSRTTSPSRRSRSPACTRHAGRWRSSSSGSSSTCGSRPSTGPLKTRYSRRSGSPSRSTCSSVVDRRGGAAARELDGDGVEAVHVAGAALAVDPGGGDLLDLAALLPGYGFEWVAVAEPGTGLHLHERDDLAAPGDEVDFLAAHAEVPVEDLPPRGLKVTGGELLAPVAEFLGHDGARLSRRAPAPVRRTRGPG
jgi:hypothetical protein